MSFPQEMLQGIYLFFFFFHKNITIIFWLASKLHEDRECVSLIPELLKHLPNKKQAFR